MQITVKLKANEHEPWFCGSVLGESFYGFHYGKLKGQLLVKTTNRINENWKILQQLKAAIMNSHD